MNSSPLFGNINSFEVSPLASISDASISSSSSKSATSMTPFQIPPAQKVHSLSQFQEVPSLQIDGFVTDPLEVGCCSTDESNGMIGPSRGSPTRLSYGVFPSDNLFCIFRRCIQWNTPTNFHPDQTAQQYPRSPFFFPAYFSSSNPTSFWTVWGWREMVPRKIFTRFPNSWEMMMMKTH